MEYGIGTCIFLDAALNDCAVTDAFGTAGFKICLPLDRVIVTQGKEAPPLTPTSPLALASLLKLTVPLPVSRMDQMPVDFTIATAVPLRLVVLIPKKGAKDNWRG